MVYYEYNNEFDILPVLQRQNFIQNMSLNNIFFRTLN